MTAAAASAQTKTAYPSFAWGPVKVQIMDISIVSGDTTATATAASMSQVDYAILCASVRQTSAPTYSNNVASFAFADPAATSVGTVMLFGK